MDYWDWLGRISSALGLLSFLGIGSIYYLKKIDPRNFFKKVGEDISFGKPIDAIIFTVSHEDLPCLMIDRMSPKSIALIASSESMLSALNIERYAIEKGVKVACIKKVDDPYNPASSKVETQHIIQTLKKSALAEIAVDVTGGTTPMSIGAFMAAHEAGIATIYLRSEFDKELKHIKQGTIRLIGISAS